MSMVSNMQTHRTKSSMTLLTEEIISVCKLLAASIVVIWLQGIHSLVNCNLPAKVLKQHLITIRLNFMAKQNECFSK